MVGIALLGVVCLHAASAQADVGALAREVVELKLAPQTGVMVVHDGKRYFASSGGVEANAVVDAWKAIANAKMLWPAGTGAQYSNIGCWLLGAAGEGG